MKEVLVQYAAYNIWANRLVLKTLKSLPAGLLHTEVAGSFSSLFQTVLHMLDAEAIWWQRMRLIDQPVVPSNQPIESLEKLEEKLIKQNVQWQNWIAEAPPHALTHEFFYHNSKKERYKQPVYQVLLHLFNHGSYHRGQLVNILRQLGITQIPQTDFIVWARKK